MNYYKGVSNTVGRLPKAAEGAGHGSGLSNQKFFGNVVND
jgi:hypothetical protein